MTARSTRRPLPGLLAVGLATCLLSLPAEAQSRGRAAKKAQPATSPAQSGAQYAGLSAPKRVALGFEGEEADIEAIAEQLDLDVIKGSERKSTWLMETEPGVTPNQLSQILVTLGTFQGTLYAEEDLRADIPDVAGCAAGPPPPGEVEPQQCTADRKSVV